MYIRYCTKTGDTVYNSGIQQSEQKSEGYLPVSKQIRIKIQEGMKRKEVEALYPSQVNLIAKLMTHRPKRMCESHCLYIHGPTKTHKTTTTYAFLNWLQKGASH